MYKGGYPAKYGGRLSSVLELTGKRGGSEQGYSIGASLLSGNISYQTPILDGLGSWIITARRSYTDILQSGTYGKIYEFVTGSDASLIHSQIFEVVPYNKMLYLVFITMT